MRLIAPLALLTLTGCAMATAPGYIGPDVQPTNRTLPRHRYHGFSVAPPIGDGWTVRVSEQTHDEAVFRRHLPTTTHTFLATVMLGQMDKSLPIEEALAPHAVKNADRSEMLENSHQLDSSRKTTCVRYSIRIRDSKAPNSPAAELYLIERGIACAHPTIPGAFVRASLSERGLEDELNPQLWTGLEDFLRGVRIESAPGVPVA